MGFLFTKKNLVVMPVFPFNQTALTMHQKASGAMLLLNLSLTPSRHIRRAKAVVGEVDLGRRDCTGKHMEYSFKRYSRQDLVVSGCSVLRGFMWSARFPTFLVDRKSLFGRIHMITQVC